MNQNIKTILEPLEKHITEEMYQNLVNQVEKTSQLFSSPKSSMYLGIIENYFNDMDKMGKSNKKEELASEMIKQLEIKTNSRYWNLDNIVYLYNNKISDGSMHESMKMYIPEGLFLRIKERNVTNEDIHFISNNNPYSEIPITIGMYTLADILSEAYKKVGLRNTVEITNQDTIIDFTNQKSLQEQEDFRDLYNIEIQRRYSKGKTKPNLQETEERVYRPVILINKVRRNKND